MVKETDVRIGNWVTDSEGNFTQIDREDFHAAAIYQDHFDNLSPIPLTPDILSKCGFEMYDNSDHIYTTYGNRGDDSDFFLQIDWRHREEGFRPLIKSNEYETIGTHITYLHQLQNRNFYRDWETDRKSVV